MTIADYKEFTKISQAVGVGFVVMGVIGFIVKLSTFVNSQPIHKPKLIFLSPYTCQQHISVRIMQPIPLKHHASVGNPASDFTDYIIGEAHKGMSCELGVSVATGTTRL